MVVVTALPPLRDPVKPIAKPAAREPKVRRRCPAHTGWVTKHACSVPDCNGLPIEAMHVRNGTNGGTGVKPTDDWTISGCRAHHQEQHQIGEPAFERKYGIDMKDLARAFAAKSPHRPKLLKLGSPDMRMAVR